MSVRQQHSALFPKCYKICNDCLKKFQKERQRFCYNHLHILFLPKVRYQNAKEH